MREAFAVVDTCRAVTGELSADNVDARSAIRTRCQKTRIVIVTVLLRISDNTLTLVTVTGAQT